MSAEIQFESVILCDDARQENNGKAILIGVYAETIVLQGPFPQQLQMQLYLEGEVSVAGKATLSFLIEDDSGGVIFRSSQHYQLPEADLKVGRSIITVPAFLNLVKEGDITVVCMFNDTRHVLTKRKIRLASQIKAGTRL